MRPVDKIANASPVSPAALSMCISPCTEAGSEVICCPRIPISIRPSSFWQCGFGGSDLSVELCIAQSKSRDGGHRQDDIDLAINLLAEQN
jgi:hypothetical protein